LQKGKNNKKLEKMVAKFDDNCYCDSFHPWVQIQSFKEVPVILFSKRIIPDKLLRYYYLKEKF
jgi:hypothetical protein